MLRNLHAPDTLEPRGSWRDRAACRTEDPDLFFPAGSTGPWAAQLVDAKRVCARCPVLHECRRYALELPAEYGVWGGLSEDERRALRRRAAA
ncbi:WhiB family transcriptional regulator [Streptomyces rimosus]|uniref:WhiB family transcriptional regulator n=1 Tax=Streptomyces rimosus TaxID=1927 RepID=UPI0031E210B6